VWLDAARRYRLQMAAGGEALGLQFDGVSQHLRHVQSEEDLPHGAPAVVVVPASLSLKSVIRCRQWSGHPVLVAEGTHIVGVCGEAEILQALSGKLHGGAA
jgi:hypothetical protein